MTIEQGTFAEACYNMNTVEELENALVCGADELDMKEWGLTESTWREQIKIAISELKADAE